MAGIESRGTVDGMPAKVVYHPDRKQTALFWGGLGRPDGPGHNHATIQDANPDAFHFLRVAGKIVVNQSYNPAAKQSRFQRDLQARGGWLGLFRESLQRAIALSFGGRRR